MSKPSIEDRQANMRERQKAKRPAVAKELPITLGLSTPPEPNFNGMRESRIAKPIVVRPWPRLLTIELAADYVGVSRSTIDEWVAEGKLHPHPLPGIRGRRHLEKIVFEKRELERFLGLRPE